MSELEELLTHGDRQGKLRMPGSRDVPAPEPSLCHGKMGQPSALPAA